MFTNNDSIFHNPLELTSEDGHTITWYWLDRPSLSASAYVGELLFVEPDTGFEFRYVHEVRNAQGHQTAKGHWHNTFEPMDDVLPAGLAPANLRNYMCGLVEESLRALKANHPEWVEGSVTSHTDRRNAVLKDMHETRDSARAALVVAA